jgi:hypothetical protein
MLLHAENKCSYREKHPHRVVVAEGAAEDLGAVSIWDRVVCCRHDPAANGVRARDAGPKLTLHNGRPPDGTCRRDPDPANFL